MENKLDPIMKNIILSQVGVFILIIIFFNKNQYILELILLLLFACLYISYNALLCIKYKQNTRIRILSLVSVILLIISVFIYLTTISYYGLTYYNNFMFHDEIFMMIFTFLLITITAFIVVKTINMFFIQKLKTSKITNYILVLAIGLIELLNAYRFFQMGYYNPRQLNTGEVTVPISVAVDRYNNDSEKMVNSFGELNPRPVFRRAVILYDADKLNKVVKIISNKKCYSYEGFKKLKLSQKNMYLPSYEVTAQNNQKSESGKAEFWGINLLGDGNVVFESSDILNTDGQATKKHGTIRNYLVELSNDEKKEIFNIICGK